MLKTKNFTQEEMEESAIAKRYHIDNSIPTALLPNCQEVLNWLQGLRDAGGSGIRITSGYRCPEVNKKCKGSTTSAHLLSYAADIQPINGKMAEFEAFVVNYCKTHKVDQCIREKSGSTKWIHIGLKNRYGQQRGQVFSITVK